MIVSSLPIACWSSARAVHADGPHAARIARQLSTAAKLRVDVKLVRDRDNFRAFAKLRELPKMLVRACAGYYGGRRFRLPTSSVFREPALTAASAAAATVETASAAAETAAAADPSEPSTAGATEPTAAETPRPAKTSRAAANRVRMPNEPA